MNILNKIRPLIKQISLLKKTRKTQTFIFVHDQDLILMLEKNKRFNMFGHYNYVFLGSKPIDKLKENNNVIIARDFLDNFEKYNKFTAFTGWYCLWKNNLINEEYVDLFEYDILIDRDFIRKRKKYLHTNRDLIGYLPSLMTNFQFIANPEWSKELICAIENEYKIDIEALVHAKIELDKNSLWSSTSNITMKRDVFIDFMDWFYPLALNIRNSDVSGHAFERAISLFALCKNKEFSFLTDVIEHLQLDSHRTQGHDTSQNLFKL